MSLSLSLSLTTLTLTTLTITSLIPLTLITLTLTTLTTRILHAHLAIASHVCLRQRKSLHRISSALICTTDSAVSQPPVILLIHVHCHQNLHFNLDMRHKLTLGVRMFFYECGKPRMSRILNDVTIIDIDQSKDHYFIRVNFDTW